MKNLIALIALVLATQSAMAATSMNCTVSLLQPVSPSGSPVSGMFIPPEAHLAQFTIPMDQEKTILLAVKEAVSSPAYVQYTIERVHSAKDSTLSVSFLRQDSSHKTLPSGHYIVVFGEPGNPAERGAAGNFGMATNVTLKPTGAAGIAVMNCLYQ